MGSTRARFVQALAALAFIYNASAAIRADQSAGTIRITIADAVVGDVLCDISADADPSRHWKASVDASHPATIGGLPATAYRVIATLPSGASAKLTLDLGPSEVVQLAVSTAHGSGAAATLALVDRHPEGHLTSFGPRDLRVLAAGGSVDSLVEAAAPFVIVDAIDSGGLEAARSRLIGSRGASGRQTSMRLGEIELMPGPATAAPALVLDLNALDAVVLTYGLARPDITGPGAAISLVPRRPGTRRAGAVDASFSGGGLVWHNDLPDAPTVGALRSWKNVNVQGGTPLTDRAGLFVSETVTRGWKVERGRPGMTPISLSSTFAHLVCNLTAHDQVRLLGTIQGLRHELAGRVQFLDTGATQRDRVSHAQASWEHQRNDGSRAEMWLAFQHGSFIPEIPSTTGGAVDGIFDGAVPSAAATSTSDRIDARVVFEPRERRLLFGSHALQFGGLAARSTSSAHIVAAPTVAELVGGLPARVWVRDIPGVDSSRQISAISTYMADRLAVSAHLTVEAGLGLGFSSGSAGTSASSASWMTVLPRMSFRWAPRGLSMFGGYSRYQPALSLEHAAFGDPGEAAVRVYRWNDADANRQLEPGETGTLVARAGRSPDVASIDPALRAPRTHEFTLGLERRLTRNSLLRAIATVRNEHAIVRSVNVGVPASAYQTRQVPDQGEDYLSLRDDRPLTVYDRLPTSFGQDRFVLMNTADRGYYGGIELTYILKTARWSSTFGAMAYRTEGFGGSRGFRSSQNDQGVLGEFLENPNAASYSDGRLFFDRSYVGKWTTAYQAPHDLSIAVVARYQDGQPFSRFVAATGLAQGPEPVAAYRSGRTRFTFTATTDLRVEQSFRVSGHRATLRLDAFNLANDANEVEENPLTGASFRKSTLLQPPRTLRLGFRFEF